MTNSFLSNRDRQPWRREVSSDAEVRPLYSRPDYNFSTDTGLPGHFTDMAEVDQWCIFSRPI